MDAAAALAAAGRIGPFFRVDAWRPGEGWRPLAELTEPAVLAERVAVARAAIAASAGVPAETIEPRVAGSITFLGLAARLLSPPLATAVLAGTVPRLGAAALWWQPTQGGPWPLAAGPDTGHAGPDAGAPDPGPASPGLARPGPDTGHAGPASPGPDTGHAGPDAGAPDPGPPGGGPDPGRLAAVLAEVVLDGLIAPVLAAFGGTFRISARVLWGNVASGLGGAAGVLAGARPDRAAATADLVEQLLDQPPLRGTARVLRTGARPPGLALRRRSCCLFYRVPGAGLCGDCVLAPAGISG